MTKYLALVLLLLTITDLFAQTSNWTFGVKPGIGWSGMNKTTGIDGEVTDRYNPGFSFAGGIRIGYRFSKYLSISLDPEWQYIQDRRSRTFNILDIVDVTTGTPLLITSRYKNKFQRIQAPLAIQFSPLPKVSTAYFSIGIMPSYISKGQIEYETKSSPDRGVIDSGKLGANFKIPANKGMNRDLIYFAGLGMSLTKRLSAELIYQFNKPIQYSTLDPGKTFVMVPVYITRANQGLMLSVIANLN